MQSDHVAHSGKVMINDRVLGATVAQTSLCIFMKAKWRKVTLIFFLHILKKKKSESFFNKEMAQARQTDTLIIYKFILKCMQKSSLLTYA